MAQYDANKKYSWKPEDTFTLTGQEFGLFLNITRDYLQSEEAAKFHREAAKFYDEEDNDKAHQSTIKAIRHTMHAKDIEKLILKQMLLKSNL